jgi:hypothetical protein
LETVSAKDHADAIAQVRTMYPHYTGALAAIPIKKINWSPPSKSEE